MDLDKDLMSRQQVRALVQAAKQAQEALGRYSQAQLDRIVEAVADCGCAHAAELGRMAHEETGFGNAADKEQKNRFAARCVAEAMRGVQAVGLLRRDDAQKIWEIGVPVGVIAGIVPSTNPTSTIIYKTLIALKSGNAIVFSPHPNAVNCSVRTAALLMEAAVQAGCPQGAIACIGTPTMDAVEELMRHEDVRLILATGGHAMVHAAYSSGKPAIGVGAGNGPAYIHHSADLPKAVRDILRSKTFDHGTICASEQSVIVEAETADAVRAEFQRQGAYFLSKEEAARVGALLLRPNGSMNPQVVGRRASEIARMAGLDGVPADATVLLARETEAGPARPYSREKLCPVLAFFTERDEDAILRRVCEVLRLEGSGHTFAIHAQDAAVIERFALRVPVSRFLVNTPSALGGIGLSTNLFPALTLGCGAVGGSASSNNIGPLDLVNLRRVAWGVRDRNAAAGHTKEEDAVDEALLNAVTEKVLRKLRG